MWFGEFQTDWHVPANLLDQANLVQISNENGNSAEGGYRSFGLTQNHSLAREQSGDFPRNCFVRGICLHPSVVASPYAVCTARTSEFRITPSLGIPG